MNTFKSLLLPITILAMAISANCQKASFKLDVPTIFRGGYGAAAEYHFSDKWSISGGIKQRDAKAQCFGPQFMRDSTLVGPYLCQDQNYIRDVGSQFSFFVSGYYYPMVRKKHRLGVGLYMVSHHMIRYNDAYNIAYKDFTNIEREPDLPQIYNQGIAVNYKWLFYKKWSLGLEAFLNDTSRVFTGVGMIQLIYSI